MENGAQDEPPLVPQKRFNGARRRAVKRCSAVLCGDATNRRCCQRRFDGARRGVALRRGAKRSGGFCGSKMSHHQFPSNDSTARSAARRCDAERRSGERGIDEPPLVPQERFNGAMRHGAGRRQALPRGTEQGVDEPSPVSQRRFNGAAGSAAVRCVAGRSGVIDEPASVSRR